MSAVKPINRMLTAFPDAVEGGNGWHKCRCPAHDDRNPSLGFTENSDGTIGLKCQAGCDNETILGRVGLQLSDLFPSNGHAKTPKPPPEPKGPAYPSVKEALAAADRLMDKKGGKRVNKHRYRDLDGNLVGLTARYDLPDGKEFRPVTRWEDGWHLCGPPGLWPLYRPSDKGGSEVWVVEGEKCADALAELGMFAVTSAGGSQSARKTDWKPIHGTLVLIIPDNDDPGRKYASEVATILTRKKSAVKIVPLAWEGMGEGDDIVEWIEHWRAKGKSDEWMRGELKRLAEEAQEYETPKAAEIPDDGRPVIVVTPSEDKINDAALEALGRDPAIFQRGGMLVRIVSDKAPATDGIRRPFGARIDAMPSAILRERMAANIHFMKEGKKGLMPSHPPGWCVSNLIARGGGEGIRHLEAVIDCPALRPDGSLLDAPGYDSGTCLYLQPVGTLPQVPAKPTRDEAVAARKTLLKVVEDFPFASREHKASWLAGVLTPLARFAYDGPSPLILCDSNIRGAGKGLMLDVGSYIVTGSEFARASYTNNEEELRKRITSVAMKGDRMVLFDNLTGKFGNAVLDAALTSTSWEDRVLGGNQMFRGPLFCTWFATGNNVQVGADTTRRICHIRLESPLERPETRKDFTHPRLLAWVKKHRARLLAAALTILRAYSEAGRPDMNLSAWGSFEGWSGLVRSAVVWAGMPDPGETRTKLQETSDEASGAMAQLLRCWEEMDKRRKGMTVARVITGLYDTGAISDGNELSLRSSIESLTDCTDRKLVTQKLGSKLRSYRRRIIDGRYIDHSGSSHNAIKWAVFPASEFKREG
jgi:hypothetical protein